MYRRNPRSNVYKWQQWRVAHQGRCAPAPTPSGALCIPHQSDSTCNACRVYEETWRNNLTRPVSSCMIASWTGQRDEKDNLDCSTLLRIQARWKYGSALHGTPWLRVTDSIPVPVSYRLHQKTLWFTLPSLVNCVIDLSENPACGPARYNQDC